MKYIKTFEEDEVKYTLEDFSKIKYWRYWEIEVNNFIFKINKIRYNVNSYHPEENRYNITIFRIDENFIENLSDVDNYTLISLLADKSAEIRPATPDEINDFETRISMGKYNL